MLDNQKTFLSRLISFEYNAAEKTHIREQKLTLEIAAAKKQRDHYLSKLEKSRAVKHIQERRKKVGHVLHTA